MSFEMESPENFDQGGSDVNRLNADGKFHFAVLNVDENPTTEDGRAIENAVFRASCVALDGTEPGQSKKEAEFTFFGPKSTHKDHGEMAKKKIFFFCKAIGCVEVVDGKMKIDLSSAAGRQFVADVEIQVTEKTDAKGNTRTYRNPAIKFCNVWHVDDPAVAQVPKDAGALRLLPAELRRAPETFQQAKPAGQPGAGNIARQAHAQHQPAKPAAGAVNLDDL